MYCVHEITSFEAKLQSDCYLIFREMTLKDVLRLQKNNIQVWVGNFLNIKLSNRQQEERVDKPPMPVQYFQIKCWFVFKENLAFNSALQKKVGIGVGGPVSPTLVTYLGVGINFVEKWKTKFALNLDQTL